MNRKKERTNGFVYITGNYYINSNYCKIMINNVVNKYKTVLKKVI